MHFSVISDFLMHFNDIEKLKIRFIQFCISQLYVID